MREHVSCPDMTLPGPNASRRQLLQWGLAGGLLACGPASLSWAAPLSGASADARLVFVLLRGGMDGLYAVPALGDPDFRSARGPLAQYASEPLRLNELFSLHPAIRWIENVGGSLRFGPARSLTLKPQPAGSPVKAEMLVETSDRYWAKAWPLGAGKKADFVEGDDRKGPFTVAAVIDGSAPGDGG